MKKKNFTLECPAPLPKDMHIQLAHGGGGSLMNELIEKVFITHFDNPQLRERHDGAIFPVEGKRLAFTTDSYVVRPLFFPGGNIGSMAVNGTVNDLAMCAAKPLYLSVAFILEEGFPVNDLERIAQAMRSAADRAGVALVTGDTKVVDRGKGDGIFINTAGIGVIDHDQIISPRSVKEGDCILLSGDLGRHGMAIMAQREGLEFESEIESDCAPLADLVLKMIDAGIEIHCLRDLTRGGLASALVEIAESAQLGVHIEESRLLVREDVQGACEILGLDPLYVANEGRFIAIVPESSAAHALEVMRRHPLGENAIKIGGVRKDRDAFVVMKSLVGVDRIVDRLSGDLLPRIC